MALKKPTNTKVETRATIEDYVDVVDKHEKRAETLKKETEDTKAYQSWRLLG